MDRDQVWSGSILFVEEASNISADVKSIRLFCDMRFKVYFLDFKQFT